MSRKRITSAEPMTRSELAKLPLTVPLWPDAARAFAIGRSTAYELATRGEFPCPVLRLGSQYRVTRSAIFEALGVKDTDAGVA